MYSMTAMDFAVISLAAYRLTHLIVFDRIFEPIRSRFVVRTVEMDSEGRPRFFFTLQGRGSRAFAGKILNCHWCAGLWVSAILVIGLLLFQDVALWFYTAMAISAVLSLIESIWEKVVGFPEMMERPK